MEVKQYIEHNLQKGGEAILVSLHLHGAFDSTCCPAILKKFREAKCPGKFFYVVQDNLKETKAIITIKNLNMGKNTTIGCLYGFSISPLIWNIQYDPGRNLQFTHHTKQWHSKVTCY